MFRPTLPVKSTLAVAAIAAAIPVGVASARPDPHDGLSPTDRKIVVEATRSFRRVEGALAAGYVPAGPCAELAGIGGMGVHYVHPTLASDAEVDLERPEILVYHPDDVGRLRLGAVEWFVADADGDVTTDTDRPSLSGHAFDGPMPGHDPDMPVHYDLHAWVYTHNPAGQLEPWNPKVSCATASLGRGGGHQHAG